VDNDARFMSLALREAERGLYTAHPNPRVGCVLVKENQVIGKGFHLQTGHGHAEANALIAADGATLGATAYVTLEPCSFRGRTPSCADALIEAGIDRVVYGMEDPHPQNRGLGFQKLRNAGIMVDGPVLEESARALNPGHIRKFESKMPFVRLKMAMSLDGKTALKNGLSQWITGPEARRDVQRLRAKSSAIVTGVQTISDDNPSLNVRQSELDVEFSQLAAEIDRKIVVLDPEKRIPLGSNVLNNPNLLLVTLNDPKNTAHLSVEQVQLASDGNRRIDLSVLLSELAARDCNEILFECGATLAGSLVSDQLVDEFIIYLAPKLMGHGSRSLLKMGEIALMEEVPELEITDVRQIGRDIRISAKQSAI
jgi:diaminohydroxyphosphoribosylaminopyrimidine deaminase/5-amino-6-(5-phosphoribosylamino)uracil reductase